MFLQIILLLLLQRSRTLQILRYAAKVLFTTVGFVIAQVKIMIQGVFLKTATICATVTTSVARSHQAFTASSDQNHGHFGTFHGHIPYIYIFHTFLGCSAIKWN
jgi:hypothetical protein